MSSPFPGRSEPHDSRRTVPSNRPLPTPDLCSASSPVILNEAGLPLDFGHYRLLARLGSGGMGTVYLAHDRHLARDVALKVLPDGADEQWRAMFLREAQAAAALDHPNLCPVYEVGEESGRPYLAMKYIKGQTLSEAYKLPVPPRQAAAVVLDLARAMGAAHACGVVHRDLKPANVMVDGLGEPVVVDFGVAVRLAPGDPRLTQEPVARGTPAYMAPEQASDPAGVGPATDVWALGVILFELVAGRRPFEGQTPLEVLVRSASDDPPSPRAINPLVDPALEAIILTCLEKNPADRYATGTALATALGGYLAPRRPAPRKRFLVAGLVVAALALAGTAIYLSIKRGEPVAKIDPVTPVAPDTKGVENKVPPVVTPNPGKNLPPIIVLERGEGNAFRTGEWEYLIDATYAGATKWLDSHRGKHSVMWLDAYMVGDKPRFAALAALDDRETKWVALLTVSGNFLIADNVAKLVDVKTHSLVSLSGYQENGLRGAFLWHPGTPPFRWQLTHCNLAFAKTIFPTMMKPGNVIRQIRPFTSSEYPPYLWAYHYNGGPPNGKCFIKPDVTKDEVFADKETIAKFIEVTRREYGSEVRPGSVAACEYEGKLNFTTTMYTDPGATDFKYELSLSSEEFSKKAETVAKDGFVPVSLTGYHTKEGGTRFCAVWVRYALPKKVGVALDPAEGKIIAVPGYEHLIDATRGGVEKWLKAHKDAKHSVMWLDAYQVGDVPRFAAIAALDGRQPEWRALPGTRDWPPRATDGEPFDRDKHALVSLSGYMEGEVSYSATLWHPGPKPVHSWPGLAGDGQRQSLTPKNLAGEIIRQLRPHNSANMVVLAAHTSDGTGKESAHRSNLSAAEVRAFLKENSGALNRSGSIAAADFKGKAYFAVTLFTDDRVTEWAADIELSATALADKAPKMVGAGFAPVSLTGYATKDGTRFCAVWVKYAPNKEPKAPVTLDPKEGTIIAVAGWEYLTDATKDGLDLWLAAQKGKRAVMWLDAYMVGGKSRFAALASLAPASPEQLDWVAHTDKKSGQIHNTADRERMIDTKKYALVSQGYYTEDRITFGVLLWRRGGPSSVNFDNNSKDAAMRTGKFSGTDLAVRQVRPFINREASENPITWYWHGDHEIGVNGEQKVSATAEEMRLYLSSRRAIGGKRPGCIAAVNRNGEVAYAATLYVDPNVSDYDFDLALSAADLPDRAKELAKFGFYPATITGYETSKGALFCVAWLKDKLKPAKKP